MPNQSWWQNVVRQKSSGTLFDAYTTAKTIINPTDLYPLYANQIVLGTALRIRALIAVSNIVTTPGTLTLQVMLDSVAVWTSGAIQLNASAHTLLPLLLDVELVCQAVGSGTTAKFMGGGTVRGKMVTRTAGQTDDAQGDQTLAVPVTTPALGTGFDSTVSHTLDLWAGFSISDAANEVQVADYSVDLMN